MDQEAEFDQNTHFAEWVREHTILFLKMFNRARVVKFTECDWSSFMGAMGEAHMVFFQEEDLRAILLELNPEWSIDETTVILDDSGITFNHMQFPQGYAQQAEIKLDLGEVDVELVPEEPKSNVIPIDSNVAELQVWRELNKNTDPDTTYKYLPEEAAAWNGNR